MSEHDEAQLEMFERAAFGKQVEAFLASDIGRYMLERAKEQKAEAYAAFKKASCSDVVQILAIQNKINVADSVVNWLVDAVQDGVTALNILEDRS